MFSELTLNLFELESPRDHIRLIANASELVFQPCEPKSIDRAIVSLQVIDPAEHHFAGVRVFV